MRKIIMTVVGCVALLCAGTALATTTPQEQCDNARVTAWAKYVSCVDAVVAKHAKGLIFDESKALWKCRHGYFKNWAGFQGKVKYAGSSCDQNVPAIGGRFKDNGDQTVTDNLSGLVWEKKDNLNGTTNVADPHDADNFYTWSTGTNKGDGTAFATFLTGAGTGLNVAGFAGAKDWRLPTLTELQTVLSDFTCTGAGGGATCVCTGPCVDPALDAANTQSQYYWSATSYVPDPSAAWIVSFDSGNVTYDLETNSVYVRAVRGGL